MPDYLRKARALRAKAADPVVPAPEAKALLEKAAELEAKYRNSNSPFTDETTVTSRDGRPSYGSPLYEAWVDAMNIRRQAQAQKIAEDLLENQWMWNTEYYDKDGKPRPTEADEDEDYGYETFNTEEGEAW